MNGTFISKATLGRLPQYLDYLKGLTGQNTISATAIAKALSLGEVQVRKDLSYVSGAGKPKIGYIVNDLIGILEKSLGYNSYTPAVLVGAGKLGRALLEYDGFEEFGVKIIAAFDNNDKVLSQSKSSKEVLPFCTFNGYCGRHNVKLGIITVGKGSAQEVCDQMIKSGITAIWNFAPCKLNVPDNVLLKQENLALSLAYLNNQLCNKI